MKKIINHPQLTLDLLLKKFDEKRSLKFFLTILKFAVKKNIAENPKLIEAAKNINFKIINGDELQFYSNILIDIWVDGSPDCEQNRSMSEEDSEKACEMFDNHVKYRAHLERNVSKYSWFENSLIFADVLDVVYRDDVNPGIVIGEYLNNLYGNKVLLDNDKLIDSSRYFCYLSKKFEVVENSPLHDLFLSIGEFLIKTQNGNNEYVLEALKCILSPRKYNGNLDTVNNIILSLNMAPKGIILAWLFNFWIYNQQEEDYNLISNEILISFFRTFPIGYNYLLNNYYLHFLSDADPVLDIKYSLSLIFDYSVFSSVCSFIRDYVAIIDDELKNIIRVIYANFSRERISLNNGFSFIEYNESEVLCFCYFNKFKFDYKDIDLTLLLAKGHFDFGELHLLGFKQGTDFDKINSFEIKNFYYKIHQIYKLLFYKFVENGYDKLANSFYSLYLLISCSRFGRCSVVDFVERASAWPVRVFKGST